MATYPLSVVRGDCLPIDHYIEADMGGWHVDVMFRWGSETYELSDSDGLTFEEDEDWDVQPAWRVTGEVPANITATWPIGRSVQYALRLIRPADGCPETVLSGPVKVLRSPHYP